MRSQWNKHPFVNNSPRKCLDNIHKTNTYGHRLYKLKQRLQRGEITIEQYNELVQSLRGMMKDGTLKYAQKLVEDKREKEFLILTGQCTDEETINDVFPNMLAKEEITNRDFEESVPTYTPEPVAPNESRYEIVERTYRGLDTSSNSDSDQQNTTEASHESKIKHSDGDAPGHDSGHDPSHTPEHAHSHDSAHTSSYDHSHTPSRSSQHAPSYISQHAPSRSSQHDPSHTSSSAPSPAPPHASDIDPEIMKLITS